MSEDAGAKSSPDCPHGRAARATCQGTSQVHACRSACLPGRRRQRTGSLRSPWPASNPVVELGTLSLDRFIADPQTHRAILFNPVSLPPGIEPSDDPILAMRFPAYAVSFGQRAPGGGVVQEAMPEPKTSNATEQLARRKNCLACHTITTRLVGPPYREVAAKYAGHAGAEDQLVQKVLKGSVGVWGQNSDAAKCATVGDGGARPREVGAPEIEAATAGPQLLTFADVVLK